MEQITGKDIKQLIDMNCFYGNLDRLQCLFKQYPDIFIENLDHNDFRRVCKNGHLKIAQWFYSIKPTIDISAENEKAFRIVCNYGYFKIAQWLYSIKPTIDISAENEYAFRLACKYGKLEVAQWLYSIKPTINISANNDFAFRWACENENLEIMKWLCELCPEKYFIEVKDNAIVSYKILNKLKKVGNKKVEQIEICPICQENQSSIITECNHQYCYECLNNWYNKHQNCPYCRQNISCCFSIV